MTNILLIIICCIVGIGVVAGIIAAVSFLRRGKAKQLRRSAVDEFLVNEFRRCNVVVFGPKGSGKDLIFAHVIALRNEDHYSNIPYNDYTEVIKLEDVSAGDNTYEDFIAGEVKPFVPRFKERCDIYISDAGVYLPAMQGSKDLDSKYPSMPIEYALSRHLYSHNIHVNTQALSRVWIKLREQADSFIHVRRSVRRGACMYVDVEWYDEYKNAETRTDPAARFTVCVPIAELHYDTRYFRTILFKGYTPAPREAIHRHCGRLRHIGGY